LVVEMHEQLVDSLVSRKGERKDEKMDEQKEQSREKKTEQLVVVWREVNSVYEMEQKRADKKVEKLGRKMVNQSVLRRD
jgi:hypothetical protein